MELLAHKYFRKAMENDKIEASIKKDAKKKIEEIHEFIESGKKDFIRNFSKIKKLQNKNVKLFEINVTGNYRLIFIYDKKPNIKRIILLDLATHDELDKKKYYRNFSTHWNDIHCEEFIQDILKDETVSDHEFPEVKDLNLHYYIANFDLSDFSSYLNNEQNGLKRNFSTPFVIKGGAGVGKTKMLAEIIIDLMKTNPEKRILYVTYNGNLINYFKNEFLELSEIEENVELISYVQLCKEIVKTQNSDDLFSESSKYTENLFRKDFKSKYAPRLTFKIDDFIVWREIHTFIKGLHVPIPLKTYLSIMERNNITHSKSSIAKSYLNTINYYYEYLNKKEMSSLNRKFEIDYFELIKKMEIETIEENKTSFKKYMKYADSIAEILEDKLSEGKLIPYDFYLNRESFFASAQEKKEIYGLAKHYQETLDEKKYWDETDLSSTAYEKLIGNPDSFKKYDYIFADEIQDINYKQIHQLLCLLNNAEGKNVNIIITGDENQLIKAMAFDWGIINSIFFTDAMTKTNLGKMTINMRNLKEIIDLGNEILKLKHLFSRNDELLLSKSEISGEKPKIFYGNIFTDEMIFSINKKDCKIIVFSGEKRDNLINAHNDLSNQILLIDEAKGLEYDIVILNGFFDNVSKRDLWNKLVASHLSGSDDLKNFVDSMSSADKKRINFELSLLYIAVTRARKLLVISDSSENSSCYTFFKGFADEMNYNDLLSAIRNEYDLRDEERREKANAYFLSGNYKYAYEEFKILGDNESASLSEALMHFYDKEFYKAYLRFSKVNRSVIAQNKEHYEIFAETLLEEKKYEEAGDIFYELNLINKAEKAYYYGNLWVELLNIYKLQNKNEEAGELLLSKLKKPLDAVPFYERAGKYKKCAQISDVEKNYYKAGEYWILERDYMAAAKSFSLHSLASVDKVLDILKRESDFELIGDIQMEIMKDEQTALNYYEKCETTSSRAKVAFIKKEYEQAGDLWISIARHSKARECYLKCDSTSCSAKALRIEKKFLESANKWRQIPNYPSSLFDLTQFIQAKTVLSVKKVELTAAECREIILHLAEIFLFERTLIGHANYGICAGSLKDNEAMVETLTELARTNNIFGAVNHFSEDFIKFHDLLLANNISKNILLGDVYYNLGNYEEAKVYYSNSVSTTDEEKTFARKKMRYIQAYTLIKKGKPNDALQIFSEYEDYDEIFNFYRKEDDMKGMENLIDYLKGMSTSPLKHIAKTVLPNPDEPSEVLYKGKEALNKIAAEFYIYAKNYKQAKKYLDKIGNNALTNGTRFELDGNYNDAAEAYLSAGLFHKALHVFDGRKPTAILGKVLEKILNFREAAFLYYSLGKYNDSLRVYSKVNYPNGVAHSYEHMGNFEKAGDYYSSMDRFEKALSMYARSGKIKKQYDILMHLTKYDKAGDLMRETNLIEEAKIAYRKSFTPHSKAYLHLLSDEFKEAAEAFAETGKLRMAGDAYLKAGLKHLAADSYRKNSDFIQAGDIYYDLNLHNEALDMYSRVRTERNPHIPRVIELLTANNNLQAVYDIFIELKHYDEALEISRKMNDNELEFACLEKLEKWEEIGNILGKSGKNSEAIEMFRRADSKSKLAEYLLLEGKYNEAGQIYEQMNDFENSLKAYLKNDSKENAARIYEKMSDFEKAGDNYFQSDKFEEAFKMYSQANNHNGKAKSLFKLGKFEDSGDEFSTAKNFDRAAEAYSKCSSKSAKAKLCELKKDWENACRHYDSIGDYDSAIRCAKLTENSDLYEKILIKSKNDRELAIFYENKKDFKNAIKHYKKLKMYEKELEIALENNLSEEIVSIYIEINQHNRAIDYLKKINDFERAAEILSIKGDLKESGDLCFENGLFESAIKYYVRLDLPSENLAICYENTNDPKMAAEMYYKLADYGNALRIAKDISDSELITRCNKALGLGKKKEVVVIVENTDFIEKKLNKEAKQFESVGVLGKALDCYSRLNNKIKMADVLVKLSKTEKNQEKRSSHLKQAIHIYANNKEFAKADNARKLLFPNRDLDKIKFQAFETAKSGRQSGIENARDLLKRFCFPQELSELEELIKAQNENYDSTAEVRNMNNQSESASDPNRVSKNNNEEIELHKISVQEKPVERENLSKKSVQAEEIFVKQEKKTSVDKSTNWERYKSNIAKNLQNYILPADFESLTIDDIESMRTKTAEEKTPSDLRRKKRELFTKIMAVKYLRMEDFKNAATQFHMIDQEIEMAFCYILIDNDENIKRSVEIFFVLNAVTEIKSILSALDAEKRVELVDFIRVKLGDYYESKKMLKEAADFYHKSSANEKAIKIFKQTVEYERYAQYLVSIGDTKKALEILEEKKDYKSISKIYESQGLFSVAALYSFNAKDFEKALLLYEKSGNPEMVEICKMRIG